MRILVNCLIIAVICSVWTLFCVHIASMYDLLSVPTASFSGQHRASAVLGTLFVSLPACVALCWFWCIRKKEDYRRWRILFMTVGHFVYVGIGFKFIFLSVEFFESVALIGWVSMVVYLSICSCFFLEFRDKGA